VASLRHGAVGIFGKIPAQGDFFRAEVSAPVVQALVSWLQQAMEPVYRLGLKLSPAPVRFLFRSPPSGDALVGVLAPGSDKVGRSFPLCAFVPVAGPGLEAGFAALPVAYRPFLDAAADLVTGVAGLDGPALVARARALPLPPGEALGTAGASLRQEARGAPAQDLARRLFGDLPAGAIAYALATLASAARQVRAREPAHAAVALDCPAERDLDRFAWLELTRVTLGWRAPPPFFWTDGPPGRILVSLGGPPAALLGHLADPKGAGSKIWPLRTAQQAAIDTARRDMGPATRLAMETPGGSVEALITAAG
jgi:type VI secretion system protein ImpM